MLVIVLVHSGCYDITPQTKCLVNNLNVFPILLETRKPKIKVGADSVSGESLVYGGYHLSLISHGRRGRGTLGICLIRALTQFMWVLCSWLNQLPKAPQPHHLRD